MLELGSAVLALVNIVVMWGMAHRWRYAWHGNLGLQLLWLPYDFVTKQYGLLALGAVMTVVSIKGCLNGRSAKPATAVRGRWRHRRPRRGGTAGMPSGLARSAGQDPRHRVRRQRVSGKWQPRVLWPASLTGRRPAQLCSPGGVTVAGGSMPVSRIVAIQLPIAIDGSPTSSSETCSASGVLPDPVVLEDAPSDDHLLDVGGALADEEHGSFPVKALDLVLLGEPVAAVDAE